MNRLKAFACFLSFLAAGVVHAQTQSIFSRDGQKATVLMLALTTNPDAMAFNRVLHVQTQEQNGKLVKKFSFKDAKGDTPLDVACAFSKIVQNTGSCFVVFHNVYGVKIDSWAGTISYLAEGMDAQSLAQNFVLPEAGSLVFRSSDGKLSIRVERQGGVAAQLLMTYE